MTEHQPIPTRVDQFPACDGRVVVSVLGVDQCVVNGDLNYGKAWASIAAVEPGALDKLTFSEMAGLITALRSAATLVGRLGAAE